MVMTLVHVTLKADVRDDPSVRQRVRRFVAELGMKEINQKRFERYGILSGEIEETAVAKIRQLAEVAAVEQDRERQSM
jgi:phosphoribosylformylglycinamidine (FGAM) synthase PurS component